MSEPFQLPMVQASAYMLDAWERSVLFLDVMRQRSQQYAEQGAQAVPHVLDFDCEPLLDGRDLPRPVNYLLVRILPKAEGPADPLKRPFVVVDPRAGHGPGIGGFKADSEIGVAMKAGHPCYFIGFRPEPCPGQTIEDILHAKAHFLERVIERHPKAEGLPCVIGNCQAGWSVAMVAALYPHLFGPIILAGTPLSYWAGVRGQYPMRYSGGLLGGSWLTALAGDLGGGVFDGALLVQNFESQNPANTLWSKQYNLWSKIDTEAARYLGFEKWWGEHVLLNAEEMQWIVDELFIGNNLAAGAIRTRAGAAIDLRNIRAPIVVFCSKGDNITPPQQALDWILDLYDSEDEIRTLGQVIVYTVHESVGHLGIFVSGGVARKEHDEFASNIDLIDVLPPGLYEAVLEPRSADDDNPEMITGDWVMRCESRSLDDIRALGGNEAEDEHRFAAAARISQVNLALYRSFAQPWLRAMLPPALPEALREFHPLRLQYQMLGRMSPLAGVIEATAERVRADRHAVSQANPFVALQERMSQQITRNLDRQRQFCERWAEDMFLALYGRPLLQSALGVDADTGPRPRKAAKNPLHAQLIQRRKAELRARIPQGGLREALARAVFYAGAPRGGLDERGFEAIRKMRDTRPDAARLDLPAFKAMLREQFLMLLIDEDAALAAIPDLLPEAPKERQAAFEDLRTILSAADEPESEVAVRLQHMAQLFGLDGTAIPGAPGPRGQKPAGPGRSHPKAPA